MDSKISTSFWLDNLCLRFNTFCSGLDESMPQDPIEFLRDKFHTTCEGFKKLCTYELDIEEGEEENTEYEPDIEEENTDLEMKINNFVSEEEGNKEEEEDKDSEGNKEEEDKDFKRPSADKVIHDSYSDFSTSVGSLMGESSANADIYADFSASVTSLIGESSANTDSCADFSTSVTSLSRESSENTDSCADLSTSVGSLIGESSENKFSPVTEFMDNADLTELMDNADVSEAAVDYVTKKNAIIQLSEHEILDKSEHQKIRDGSQDLDQSLVIVDESCLFTDLQDKKTEGEAKLAEKPSSSSSGVVEAVEEDWEIVSLDEGS